MSHLQCTTIGHGRSIHDLAWLLIEINDMNAFNFMITFFLFPSGTLPILIKMSNTNSRNNVTSVSWTFQILLYWHVAE